MQGQEILRDFFIAFSSYCKLQFCQVKLKSKKSSWCGWNFRSHINSQQTTRLAVPLRNLRLFWSDMKWEMWNVIFHQKHEFCCKHPKKHSSFATETSKVSVFVFFATDIVSMHSLSEIPRGDIPRLKRQRHDPLVAWKSHFSYSRCLLFGAKSKLELDRLGNKEKSK